MLIKGKVRRTCKVALIAGSAMKDLVNSSIPQANRKAVVKAVWGTCMKALMSFLACNE